MVEIQGHSLKLCNVLFLLTQLPSQTHLLAHSFLASSCSMLTGLAPPNWNILEGNKDRTERSIEIILLRYSSYLRHPGEQLVSATPLGFTPAYRWLLLFLMVTCRPLRPLLQRHALYIWLWLKPSLVARWRLPLLFPSDRTVSVTVSASSSMSNLLIYLREEGNNCLVVKK